MPRKARVEIGTTGAGRVRRALRGIVQEAVRAETTVRRESRRTLSEDERAQRERVRNARRAAQQMAREWQRHERQKRREMQRTTREAEQNARREERARRVASRDRRRAVGGAVLGGVVGGIHAAASFSSQAQGRLGLQDPADMVLTAKQINEDLIRALSQAGFDQNGIDAALHKIDQAAKRNKVFQEKLAGAVVFGQERFSDPRAVLENLDFIAQLSRASGAEPAAIAGFGLTAKQAGRLNDEDLRPVLATAFTQTGEGAIEFGDLSGSTASTVAQIAAKTGAQGRQQILEITAIIQALGKSLKNAPEVATLGERLFMQLNRAPTLKKLQKLAGVRIADKEGRPLGSPLETIQKIVQSPKLRDNALLRQKVFADILGEEGAATLIKANERDPELLNRLAKADPAEGERVIELINKRLDASPFTKVDELAIQAQSVTLQGGKLTEALIEAARTRTELATENPVAFEAVGPVTQVLTSIGLGGLALKLLGGGAAAGAGASAATAAGTGAAGTAAAGAAGVGLGTGALAALPALALGGAIGTGALALNDLASEYLGLPSARKFIEGLGASFQGPSGGSIGRSETRGTGTTTVRLDDASIAKLGRKVGEQVYRERGR